MIPPPTITTSALDLKSPPANLRCTILPVSVRRRPRVKREAILKFGYFNQLQMPKPWQGDDLEVDLYRHALEQAIHAEAVGFHAYWQTEHHFYTEIGHSSA